jgi:hypothetical protein
MMPDPRDPQVRPEPGLPRRDWLLLPLLGLATIVITVLAVEMIARHLYFESQTTTFPCLVTNDPSTGVRGVPNSTCSQKILESQLVRYQLNSCGHRAGVECGPKPADAYRIVLVGSSFAYGMWIPRELSFAALLPAELSRRTGRKIELYNESMQWGTPHSVDLRFKEALAANPDMVLWTLTPYDIENAEVTLPYVPPVQMAVGTGDAPQGIRERVIAAFRKKSPADLLRDSWARFIEVLDQSRTVFVLQHFLYQSQSQYVKHFLLHGKAAEFLRAEPGSEWQGQLALLDTYAADLATQSQSAGVRLVVTMLPQRAQAAMISSGDWPAGFDPFRVGEDVRAIALKHGATYVDVLHGFRTIPNPETHYFPVDGHIDADGHTVLSGLISNALLQDASIRSALTAPASPTAGAR